MLDFNVKSIFVSIFHRKMLEIFMAKIKSFVHIHKVILRSLFSSWILCWKRLSMNTFWMNNRCCPQLCKYNLSFIFIAINALMVICLNPNVTNMPTHFLDRDISTGLFARFDNKHFYASVFFFVHYKSWS